MALVTMVDTGKGQHHCLDRGRSELLGVVRGQRVVQAEEECLRRVVFVSKGSDYVIYSQRLAQLQEPDPHRASLFLTRCGMWSHRASRW